MKFQLNNDETDASIKKKVVSITGPRTPEITQVLSDTIYGLYQEKQTLENDYHILKNNLNFTHQNPLFLQVKLKYQGNIKDFEMEQIMWDIVTIMRCIDDTMETEESEYGQMYEEELNRKITQFKHKWLWNKDKKKTRLIENNFLKARTNLLKIEQEINDALKELKHTNQEE